MTWGAQTNPRGTALTGRRSPLPGAAELAEMVRDGLTAEDIASVHGCAPTTVDSHLRVAGYNPRTGIHRDDEPPADDGDDRLDLAELVATATAPGAWVAEALCTQTDPEAFFPEKGESIRAAKAVCRRCPVAAECLDFALEADEAFGVWGGLSERERRALTRPNRTHGCKGCGQPIHVYRRWCDPCRTEGTSHESRTAS